MIWSTTHFICQYHWFYCQSLTVRQPSWRHNHHIINQRCGIYYLRRYTERSQFYIDRVPNASFFPSRLTSRAIDSRWWVSIWGGKFGNMSALSLDVARLYQAFDQWRSRGIWCPGWNFEKGCPISKNSMPRMGFVPIVSPPFRRFCRPGLRSDIWQQKKST